jgi:hypothetical protein
MRDMLEERRMGGAACAVAAAAGCGAGASVLLDSLQVPHGMLVAGCALRRERTSATQDCTVGPAPPDTQLLFSESSLLVRLQLTCPCLCADGARPGKGLNDAIRRVTVEAGLAAGARAAESASAGAAASAGARCVAPLARTSSGDLLSRRPSGCAEHAVAHLRAICGMLCPDAWLPVLSTSHSTSSAPCPSEPGRSSERHPDDSLSCAEACSIERRPEEGVPSAERLPRGSPERSLERQPIEPGASLDWRVLGKLSRSQDERVTSGTAGSGSRTSGAAALLLRDTFSSAELSSEMRWRACTQKPSWQTRCWQQANR